MRYGIADFMNLSVLVHTGLYLAFLILVSYILLFSANHVLCIGCLLAFLANFILSTFLLSARVFMFNSVRSVAGSKDNAACTLLNSFYIPNVIFC